MLTDVCQDAGFILRIIVNLIKYAHIIIPILLILLITFDLFKVLTGPTDEKSKSEAFSKAVKRLIYAIIVFFVPTIINFVFKTVDRFTDDNSNATTTTATSWISCWTEMYNK